MNHHEIQKYPVDYILSKEMSKKHLRNSILLSSLENYGIVPSE
jgi:hypothetical protein